MPEHPNETIQQLQTPLQQDMDLNAHSIQKQHPSVLQHHQQPHITIHQLPISNTVVSYSDMVNSSPTSTIHISSQIVENSPASVHPSIVNPGSSIQTSTVALHPPLIGLAGLSDSNEVALKAEYTEPNIEYS